MKQCVASGRRGEGGHGRGPQEEEIQQQEVARGRRKKSFVAPPAMTEAAAAAVIMSPTQELEDNGFLSFFGQRFSKAGLPLPPPFKCRQAGQEEEWDRGKKLPFSRPSFLSHPTCSGRGPKKTPLPYEILRGQKKEKEVIYFASLFAAGFPSTKNTKNTKHDEGKENNISPYKSSRVWAPSPSASEKLTGVRLQQRSFRPKLQTPTSRHGLFSSDIITTVPIKTQQHGLVVA